MKTYSVEEIKALLALDGFEYSQHFTAWHRFQEQNVNWELIERVTALFDRVTPDLDKLDDLLAFLSKQVDFTGSICPVRGSSTLSIRVAPSINSGAVPDTSWLTVGNYWSEQYWFGLSETGKKGSVTWGTGKRLDLALGVTPTLNDKAVDMMSKALRS